MLRGATCRSTNTAAMRRAWYGRRKLHPSRWWSRITSSLPRAVSSQTTVPTCLRVTGEGYRKFPGLSVHLKFGTLGTTVIPFRWARLSLPHAHPPGTAARHELRPVQRHRPRHSRRRHAGDRRRPRLQQFHSRTQSHHRRASIHLSLVRYQCTGAFDCGWEGCTEIHPDARKPWRSRLLSFLLLG